MSAPLSPNRFPVRLVAMATIATLCIALPVVLGALRYAEETASAARAEYGTAMVTRLAASAQDGLLADDGVALSVLTRQFTELPGIASARIYSADNRLLASNEAAADPTTVVRPHQLFVREITLQDSVAGFARIELVSDQFTEDPARWLMGGALLSLLLLVLAAWVTGALVGRRLRALRLHLEAELLRDADAEDDWRAINELLLPVPEPEPTEPDDPGITPLSDAPRHLIVVNLFNQISLSAEERTEVLDRCESLLAGVCSVYGGRQERLQGTGILIALEALTDQSDHAFQAICAALLAARVFEDLNLERRRDGEVHLALRIGVERISEEGPEDADAPDLAERFEQAVSHGVTLSALARDQAVVISEAVMAGVPDRQRLQATELQSAALKAMGTSSAWLVEDVAESYRGLLDRQAQLLSSSQ